MKLWEDQTVVEALQHILEGYPRLEYDEISTKRAFGDSDMLKVKVTGSSANRDSIAHKITSELSKATCRKFIHVNPVRKSEYIIIMELGNHYSGAPST